MTTMSGKMVPCFYKLPEELLTQIVDSLGPPWTKSPFGPDHSDGPVGKYTLSDLKNLRLVHPRLAFLSRLESLLFDKIWLTRDRPNKDQSLADLHRIAKYVHEVEFSPKLRIFLERADVAAQDSQNEQDRALPKKIDFLGPAEASTRWTNILALCSNVERIVLDVRSSEPDWVFNGPSRNVTGSIALQCLAAAKIRATSLRISYAVDSFYGLIPELRDVIDLTTFEVSKLENVCLRMECAMRTLDICALLQICAPRIRSITLESTNYYLRWPDQVSFPAMPELCELEIRNFEITPGQWAQWIASFPKARSLSLFGVASNIPLEQWQPLFAAIRNHATRMYILMEGPVCDEEDDEVWISHDTAEPPSILSLDWDEVPMWKSKVAQVAALEAYMSQSDKFQEWLPWTTQL